MCSNNFSGKTLDETCRNKQQESSNGLFVCLYLGKIMVLCPQILRVHIYHITYYILYIYTYIYMQISNMHIYIYLVYIYTRKMYVDINIYTIQTWIFCFCFPCSPHLFVWLSRVLAQGSKETRPKPSTRQNHSQFQREALLNCIHSKKSPTGP